MPFPVDWTDLIADDHENRTRSLYNRNGDVYLIIHHAYNYNVYQTISTFKSKTRTVSANFALGPKVSGGRDAFMVRTVLESDRAYTTSSSYDDRALTVETSNINLNEPYPVSLAAKQKLAQLAAYMHREYKMPLDRWHVTSHQEVYKRGWGSYATACPGTDLQGSLDWIVAEAKRIVASGTAGGGTTPIVEKETKVKAYHFEDRTPFTLAPGASQFMRSSVKPEVHRNIVGGIGQYSITPHVYAEGQPGDEIELSLMWQDTTKPSTDASRNSFHYIERIAIGPDARTADEVLEDPDGPGFGFVAASTEFKRAVAAGFAVYLQVRAVSSNAAPVKITVLDSDAFLFLEA